MSHQREGEGGRERGEKRVGAGDGGGGEGGGGSAGGRLLRRVAGGGVTVAGRQSKAVCVARNLETSFGLSHKSLTVKFVGRAGHSNR